MYKITCHGPICRDVSIQVKIRSGDADLYGKEDRPPQIQDSNCASCTCKSRSSDLVDKCIVTTESKLHLNISFCQEPLNKKKPHFDVWLSGISLQILKFQIPTYFMRLFTHIRIIMMQS